MRLRVLTAVPPLAVGLALFSGSAAWAGGGFCHQPASEGTGATVELTKFCFSPTVVRVQPGTTVTWVNRDSLEHVVTGASVSFGGFDRLGPGTSITQTFNTPGIFPYTCSLHFGMSGAVVVGDGAPVAASQVDRVASTAAVPTGAGPSTAVALILALAAGIIGFVGGRLRRLAPTAG